MIRRRRRSSCRARPGGPPPRVDRRGALSRLHLDPTVPIWKSRADRRCFRPRTQKIPAAFAGAVESSPSSSASSPIRPIKVRSVTISRVRASAMRVRRLRMPAVRVIAEAVVPPAPRTAGRRCDRSARRVGGRDGSPQAGFRRQPRPTWCSMHFRDDRTDATMALLAEDHQASLDVSSERDLMIGCRPHQPGGCVDLEPSPVTRPRFEVRSYVALLLATGSPRPRVHLVGAPDRYVQEPADARNSHPGPVLDRVEEQ